MPILIDAITLPEPVEIELKYEPVVLYDAPAIEGTLHKIYKPITKFEDTLLEYDTIKFQEEYTLTVYDLTEADYQALAALDGGEVTLRIRRCLVLTEGT